MFRNIAINAIIGHSGFSITEERLLTDKAFSGKADSVTGLSLHPKSHKTKEAAKLGVEIVTHKHDRERDMVKLLQQPFVNTLCLIPLAHQDKYDITVELVNAARKANVLNVLFLSSAGADLAERGRQPHLREFVDLETLVLASKGDSSKSTGHSPCVNRASFYAENLLLYAPQIKEQGLLPIPIDKDHKFAPVALGLMIVTGPMLATGDELATPASSALGKELQFENISGQEAEKVFKHQSESDASELQYLLEYYSLVREGKTNYISTTAFVVVTGNHPTDLTEFFKLYAGNMPLEPTLKKRKLGNGH
ncbi:hypothetical protein LTR53_014237 [Teratosphaeriaceae sp. CCFEE 6253]|nr:hypothetical protein LTR53_014237 [Teratosphaeriaceae sp. CCFEE 6253]